MASGLIFAFLVNWAIKDLPLWYWAPSSQGELLKFYALATDRREYDVLIMGSSVSNLGLVAPAMAEELDRLVPRPKPWQVFNASVDGAFFPTYMEIMRGIVGRRQRPQAIVWMVAVRDFNAASRQLNRQIRYFTKEPADWEWIFRYAPRLDARTAALRSLWRGLEALWQGPAYFAFAGEVDQFRAQAGQIFWDPFPGEGEELSPVVLPRPPERPREELRADRLKRLQRKVLNDFELNPLIDRWLGEVVEEAQRKQVTLLVFLAPESEWLASRLYTDEREQVRAYLESASRSRGFTWVDLAEPPFRPDEAAYFDGADHLGLEGALELTGSLTRLVLAPRLGAAPAE